MARRAIELAGFEPLSEGDASRWVVLGRSLRTPEAWVPLRHVWGLGGLFVTRGVAVMIAETQPDEPFVCEYVDLGGRLLVRIVQRSADAAAWAAAANGALVDWRHWRLPRHARDFEFGEVEIAAALSRLGSCRARSRSRLPKMT